MTLRAAQPLAYAGGLWASGLQEGSTDPAVLDSAGRWLVVMPYSGTPAFLRFADWSEQPPAGAIASWHGPDADAWSSSLDMEGYCAAVARTREEIAKGRVYQANVCRVMRTALAPEDRDVAALHQLLLQGNPAPHSAMVRVPELGLHIASASPELFIARHGAEVTSGPIKGTGRTSADLTDKDRAENVMIVDLVRNDLARVSEVGSVEVASLLREEHHPGLVHLVSEVTGRLLAGTGWGELLAAAFPPGSVTGAPKSTALALISELEPVPRSFYCGAIGWVDADRQQAELAVAIRTFWIDGEALCFGTGAGITWGSDPQREWRETELKAQHLVSVASGSWVTAPGTARQEAR
ncbi:MAG: chorismate-binding protein [Candidatus Nanopelagicales bacterium]|nr:chorismate-binding protein [Candidatus Nanopelagicales bacterium]